MGHLRVTGRGTRKLGDLMSGTLAAAAYCCLAVDKLSTLCVCCDSEQTYCVVLPLSLRSCVGIDVVLDVQSRWAADRSSRWKGKNPKTPIPRGLAELCRAFFVTIQRIITKNL